MKKRPSVRCQHPHGAGVCTIAFLLESRGYNDVSSGCHFITGVVVTHTRIPSILVRGVEIGILDEEDEWNNLQDGRSKAKAGRAILMLQ